jgi:hypothetical protein
MRLQWGTDPANAIYSAEIESRDYGFGCHQYFVQYTTSDGRMGTFPEEGSYLYGSDCDAEVLWISSQQGWTPDLEPRTTSELTEDLALRGGCASAPSRAWLGLAAVGALAAALRRRAVR